MTDAALAPVASEAALLADKQGGAANASSSSSPSGAGAAAWELSLYGTYEHKAQGGMPDDVTPFQDKLKAAYDEALSRSSQRSALKEGGEVAAQFGHFRGLMLKGAVGHFPVWNYGYLHDP